MSNERVLHDRSVGFLQLGVLTIRGSYNQGFLRSGVLTIRGSNEFILHDESEPRC